MCDFERDFDFVKPIGSGRDGDVFCVRSKSTGQLFALKTGDPFTVNFEEFEFTKKAYCAAGIGPYAFNFFSEINSETGVTKNSILMEYIDGECIDRYPVCGSTLSEILDNYYGLGVYHSVWQNDLKGANVLCRKTVFNDNAFKYCFGRNGFSLNIDNQFSSKGLVLIDYGIASSSCTPTALENDASVNAERPESNICLLQSGKDFSIQSKEVGLMCNSEYGDGCMTCTGNCRGVTDIQWPCLDNKEENPEDSEMILSENLEYQYNHMVKMVSLFIQSLIFPEKYYESVEDSKSFVLSLSIPSKTRYLNMLIFHGYNWLLKNFGYRDCKLNVDILSNINPDLLSCKDLNCGKYSISLPKTPSVKKFYRDASSFSREINENRNNVNIGVISQPGITVKKQATVCKEICFDDADFLTRRPRQLTFC